VGGYKLTANAEKNENNVVRLAFLYQIDIVFYYDVNLNTYLDTLIGVV
jgi:hypothetical protein